MHVLFRFVIMVAKSPLIVLFSFGGFLDLKLSMLNNDDVNKNSPDFSHSSLEPLTIDLQVDRCDRCG